MDIQRLRNITTERLHTSMDDIYEDIEFLTGEKWIMTHHLPVAVMVLCNILKSKIDVRFFDGLYDTSHVGEVDINPLSADERDKFLNRLNVGMEESYKSI